MMATASSGSDCSAMENALWETSDNSSCMDATTQQLFSSLEGAAEHCSSQHQHALRQPKAAAVFASSPDHLINMFRQQMLMEQGQPGQLDRLAPQQPATRAGARMIVVSWMVEVAEEFRLQQETLHLAVLLLDRFIASSEIVPHCVLQLLAIGCIFLASKDLEVYNPTVEQLCDVTANHFQPRDLLRIERIILNVLEFRLSSAPSSYTFLHLLAQSCSSWVTPAVLSLAMYLCELAMLDACAHTFSHSRTAASALLLAQESLGGSQHTPAIKAAAAACMGLDSLQGLGPCMMVLLRLQQVAAMAAGAAGSEQQSCVNAELASAHYTCTPSAAAAAGSPASAAAAAGLPAYAAEGDFESVPSFVSPAATDQLYSFSQTAAPVPAANQECQQQQQPEDLLAPLRLKFGSADWCGVSGVCPLALLPAQV